MAKKEWLKKTDEGLAIIRPLDRDLAILTRKPKFRAECQEIESKFDPEYKLLRRQGGGVFGIEILKKEGCARPMTAEEVAALQAENSEEANHPPNPISIDPAFLTCLEEFQKRWGIWPCDPVSISSPLEAPMGAVLYGFPVPGPIGLPMGFSFRGACLFLPVYPNTTWPKIEAIFPAITERRKEVYGKEKGEKDKFEVWLFEGDVFLGHPGIKIVIPIFPNTTVQLIKKKNNWSLVEILKEKAFGKERANHRERDEFWKGMEVYDKMELWNKLEYRGDIPNPFDIIAKRNLKKKLKTDECPLNPEDILKEKNRVYHQYRAAYLEITGREPEFRREKPKKRLSKSGEQRLISLCIGCLKRKGNKALCKITGHMCKVYQNLDLKIEREKLRITVKGRLRREVPMFNVDAQTEYGGENFSDYEDGLITAIDLKGTLNSNGKGRKRKR